MTLAFDTSTSFGSVVLFENHQILFEKSWLREKSHSEMLTTAIDLAFQTSSRRPQELKRLIVGVGPGSFTGIRVAVNVARSLAYALKLQVHCVDSFDLLALGVDPALTTQENLLGLIDAYNNEVFCARFEKIKNRWQKISLSQSKTLKNLSLDIQTPHLCVGEAYNQYEPYLSPELKKLLIRESNLNHYPNVKFLGLKSEFLDLSATPLAWNQVQALYIKASAAEEKLKETN